MKYYKFLPDKGLDLTNSLRKYIENNSHLISDRQNSFIFCNVRDVLKNVPLFSKYFEQYELTIEHISLFVSYRSRGKIHIDDDIKHPLRINIPVINCDNTETIHYETTFEGKPFKQLDGKPLYVFEKDQVQAVIRSRNMRFSWMTQFYYSPEVNSDKKTEFETLDHVFRQDVAAVEKQKIPY